MKRKGSHTLGLTLAFATLAAIAIGACGSSNSSRFGAPNGPSDSPDASRSAFGDSGPCEGLQCQRASCTNGRDTRVTGTVFAPNGTLPLYNAIVYVPNTTPQALTKGATCDTCGKVTGSPVVSTLSDATGNFILRDVPAGKDIPLVIQIGKWRRQVKIPNVAPCAETKLADPELTRLPKNQSEGDMPRIALTTGGCDKLGCMLPKVGIDPSEFGIESDGPSKAVHSYLGLGGSGASAPGAPPGAPLASSLWSSLPNLMKYDLAILSCECAEHLDDKGGSETGAPFGVMSDYMRAGGRIFTTDFMYTWYRYAGDAPLSAAASWRGGAPPAGSPMTFDGTFPKGKALIDWLDVVGATPIKGQLVPEVVWGNVVSIDSTKAQAWARSGNPNAAERVFTVNVPIGVPAAEQCGRGVHIDAHLNYGPPDQVDSTYPAGCNSPLKPGENLLAFFFFDLVSCIQNDSAPPTAPPVVK